MTSSLKRLVSRFACISVMTFTGLVSSCSHQSFIPSDIPLPKAITNGELIPEAGDNGLLAIAPKLYEHYRPKTRLVIQRIRFLPYAQVRRIELLRVVGAIDFLLEEFILPRNLPQKITIIISEEIEHRPQTSIVDENHHIITISRATLTRSRQSILVHELFHALYTNATNSNLSHLHELWATYAQLIYENRKIDDNLELAKLIAWQHQISFNDYLQQTRVNLWEQGDVILTNDTEYAEYVLPIFLFDRVSNLSRVIDYVDGVAQQIPNMIQYCKEHLQWAATLDRPLGRIQDQCSLFVVKEQQFPVREKYQKK